MKRDWDLIRELLNQAESCDPGVALVFSKADIYSGKQKHYNNFPQEKLDEIYHHILLLRDAGLVEINDFGSYKEGIAGAAIQRLTMKGHDFIEAARKDTIWEKTKAAVQEYGGGVTVDLFKDLLIGFAKHEITKHTGINI